MMSSHPKKATPSHLVGLALLFTLTAVGCNKNPDSEKNSADQTQVDNVLVPVVGCDERLVASQLEQAIKASINTQAQRQFNTYAQAAGETLSSNKVTKATNAILVDIANPTVMETANEQGMVTCRASLNLTLPAQDVTRASEVYSALEGRNLADVLYAKNILLTDNRMLTNDFSYVVGMQGAQTKSRLVGQPEIIAITADMIAKSQFQSTLDANLGVPKIRQPRTEPELPSEPSLRPEPKVRAEPEPKIKARIEVEAEKKVQPTKAKPRAKTSEQVGPGKDSNVEIKKSAPKVPRTQPSSSQSQGPAYKEPVIDAPTSKSEAKKGPAYTAPVIDTPAKKSATERGPAHNASTIKTPSSSYSGDDIDVVIVEEEGSY